MREEFGYKLSEAEGQLRQLQETVREVGEQRYKLQVELDRVSLQNESKVRGLELLVGETKKENERLLVRVATMDKDMKDKEDYFSQQMRAKDEQTCGQIRYLTNRLKEVSNG
jgi:excinuclease UvrABC ATPase subunit